jgi:hypothetical protein
MYRYDSKIITLSDMLVYFEVLPQAGSNDATVGTSFSQLLESKRTSRLTLSNARYLLYIYFVSNMTHASMHIFDSSNSPSSSVKLLV